MTDSFKDTYISAQSFYNQGCYAQARPLFEKLCKETPSREECWRGLASSLQMLEQWEEALVSWKISSFLAIKDPLPLFHTAECFYQMNHKEGAVGALFEARQRASLLSGQEDVLSDIQLLTNLIDPR
jgi:tetratricopeptide (TPR) repeat protein